MSLQLITKCLDQLSPDSMNVVICADSLKNFQNTDWQSEKWFQTLYTAEGIPTPCLRVSHRPIGLIGKRVGFVSVKESLRTTAHLPNVVFTHTPAAERCVHRQI